MANYHVTKNRQSDNWRVTREGASRASDTVGTQQRAEKIAKRLAHTSGGGEVRIHRENGKIRDSDTIAPGNEGPGRDTKH